jgi:hypothetical protein
MNDRPETFSNGESRVLELATRLLSDEDPVARAVLKPRIFVGRLPEDMPVEIPIPDNFDVVGSLVRSEPDPHGEPTVEVVLDARMPAEQVRDGGWSFSEEGYGGRQAWSGVFLALRLAGSPRRYFLFVHIIRTRDHHGSP